MKTNTIKTVHPRYDYTPCGCYAEPHCKPQDYALSRPHKNAADNIRYIRDKYGVTLSEKNKKLQPAPGKYNFLIFNLPAVKTCPFATPSCVKLCYALKAERLYPNVKIARARNYAASLQDNFTEVMIQLIDLYMNKPKYKNIPCYFRIHESGDFYSKEYYSKWIQIIEYCRDKYSNLYFCFYTKSIAFIDITNYEEFKRRRPNVSVNISLWADSPDSTREFIKRGNFPVYTAATAEALPALLADKSNKKCRCSDCGACRMCLVNHKTNLTKICEIH